MAVKKEIRLTAVKKEAGTGGGQRASSQDVVVLLTEILDEFRKQVQSKIPPPLEGAAVLAVERFREAVERFREIEAALALQPRPTITLTNDAPQGGTVTLRWSSTGAQTVLIDQEVGGVTKPLGELTPPAGGSKAFSGDGTTKFTATAKDHCSATASVTVLLSS